MLLDGVFDETFVVDRDHITRGDVVKICLRMQELFGGEWQPYLYRFGIKYDEQYGFIGNKEKSMVITLYKDLNYLQFKDRKKVLNDGERPQTVGVFRELLPRRKLWDHLEPVVLRYDREIEKEWDRKYYFRVEKLWGDIDYDVMGNWAGDIKEELHVNDLFRVHLGRHESFDGQSGWNEADVPKVIEVLEDFGMRPLKKKMRVADESI